jgi:hypothetical protein
MVALRSSVNVLAETDMVTVPLSLPVSPAVTSAHYVLLLVAVHATLAET